MEIKQQPIVAENEMRRSRRGGRREGAGRKPKPDIWRKFSGFFLYIVHEVEHDAVCKIGIAQRPFDRLRGHQVSTWRRLKIAAAFDCETEETARIIEKHLCMALKGRHVTGEWFDAPPDRIVQEIADFTAENAIKISRVDPTGNRSDVLSLR